MGPHHRGLSLLTLIFILGLAACGSGSSATGQLATSTPAGHCPTSAGLPSNASDHGTAPASGSQLAIEANDFFFSATCVTGVPGGTLPLTVHNAGQALHNVSIPPLHIDRDVSPGHTIPSPVRMASTPFSFFSKFHNTSG